MAQLCVQFTFFLSVVCNMAVSKALDSAEQESVYRIMESVNSDVSWRTLFPDDLCSSGPHGVVCDYFSDADAHVTELSFGYISDYSPNPPCNSHSTLNLSLLAPLSHLRKLFFYKCFIQSNTPFPYFQSSSSLEELVFIDNPGLTGCLDGRISNLTRLRRLILTGTRVSGGISEAGFSELRNLEQLTLSRNRFNGEISMNIFTNMKKLKILDLSENGFEGNVAESMRYSSELLKIDLSHNKFSGRIPVPIPKNVEVFDLSDNNFEGFVPGEIGDLEFVKLLNLENNNLSGRVPFSAAFVSKLGGNGMLRLEGNLDLCIDDESAKVVSVGNLKVCSAATLDYVSKTAPLFLRQEFFSNSPCSSSSMVFGFGGFSMN